MMLIAFITTILVSLSFEQKVTYTFPEFPYKETNKNVSSPIQVFLVLIRTVIGGNV
jgi:hypothetical protein